MKKTKRFLALMTAGFLAVTPMAATGLTAVAETITVNNATSGYSYSAYPVFSGTLSDGKLVGLDWATGFNDTAFLAALKADLVLRSDFLSASTADDVATILSGYNETTDVEKLAQFAKLAKDNVGSAAGTQNTQTSSTYPITVSGAGYYLIEETNSTSGEPISRYMLEVAGNATVSPKRPIPSLTKVITSANQNNDGSANTASIGDVVDYQITSAIPDMTGYDKYFFIINDTLESGLTFNENTVSVDIGDTTLVKDTDYYIKTSNIGDKTFEIVFTNFEQRTENVGTPITVTYNATVNNNATAGSSTTDANTNTANLTYSNNPNISSDGDSSNPDEPDNDDPVGTTPDQVTYTYLTDLIIEKVDAADPNNKLAGAKFELTGTSLNSVLHEAGLYVKDDSADPAYYLLTDGTYTATAPGGVIAGAAYASTTQKYAFTTATSLSGTETKVTAFGTSAENTGLLTFGKLGAGTYTIKETAAPSGYNSLPSPITVTITANPTASGCTWSYQKDSGTPGSSNTIQVQNASGATLPSTGGIGTKLFYIFGSILVAGSVIFLVTKKRMSAKEN